MKMRPSYDGPWNQHWVRLDDFVVALERRQRRGTVWHRFLRNLFVFFLLVLYGTLALAPETRRALVKAARQTFVDVPFDVGDTEPQRAAVAYRVRRFEDIHTEDQFWAWAHNVLHRGVFVQVEEEDGVHHMPSYAEGFNRVLWGIRFRQLRTKHETHYIAAPGTRGETSPSASPPASSTGSATVSTSCDPNQIPPIFAENPELLSSLRCKSGGAVDWSGDEEKYDEVDFGFATTREELNVRGIAVNVTSAEWKWKPSTYDEGLVKIASRLPGRSDYLLDTSGYIAMLPLNETLARAKLFAMQYGRRLDTGKPITSAQEAEGHAEESASTKFLSEQTAALFVTLHSYNTGSGYVTRLDFVVERSQEGNFVASFDALSAQILPCTNLKSVMANIFGVILVISGIAMSLMVLNDIRRGGQYLEWWIIVDLLSAGMLCVHVWWSARQLIFGVDSTRFMSSLGTPSVSALSSSNSSSSSSSSDNLIDSPSAFKDMQYALIWDQTTQSILGINLLLIFVRLMSLTEALPLARVIFKAFQSTANNIAYFLIIYYGMLTAFAVGTMVLLAPAADGFQTFSGAFINLQRAANGELSIWKIVEPEWHAGGQRISMLGIIGTMYHTIYMTIFKWLLVEGVLLGLILDSWVRVYAQEKVKVAHEKKRLKSQAFARAKAALLCPTRVLGCLRNHCCLGPREWLSWSYDRCRHGCEIEDEEFEAYAYARTEDDMNDDREGRDREIRTRIARSNPRTRMSISDALARVSAWRSLEINRDVMFVNFQLMSMALSARLPTDHKDFLGRKDSRHRRGRGEHSISKSHSLTFDDVVWFLEIMVLPYKPRSIEHQPYIYTSEERQAAVLAYRRQAEQGAHDRKGRSRSSNGGGGPREQQGAKNPRDKVVRSNRGVMTPQKSPQTLQVQNPPTQMMGREYAPLMKSPRWTTWIRSSRAMMPCWLR